jgi:hypothetical protein
VFERHFRGAPSSPERCAYVTAGVCGRHRNGDRPSLPPLEWGECRPRDPLSRECLLDSSKCRRPQGCSSVTTSCGAVVKPGGRSCAAQGCSSVTCRRMRHRVADASSAASQGCLSVTARLSGEAIPRLDGKPRPCGSSGARASPLKRHSRHAARRLPIRFPRGAVDPPSGQARVCECHLMRRRHRTRRIGVKRQPGVFDRHHGSAPGSPTCSPPGPLQGCSRVTSGSGCAVGWTRADSGARASPQVHRGAKACSLA